MVCAPRFRESAFNRRPYGCHRYDVYSPKLHRQVTLFGLDALDLWTTLEASSQVASYCERPLLIPESSPQRAFDFWVQRPQGEELLILKRAGDLKNQGEANATLDIQALSGISVQGIPVRCIDPADMAQHRIALANWGTIIRDLAAFERFVPDPLCREIKTKLERGKSIAQLQSELPDFDGSIVRLAVYALLHRGQAICGQLATRVLSPNHVIELP